MVVRIRLFLNLSKGVAAEVGAAAFMVVTIWLFLNLSKGAAAELGAAELVVFLNLRFR
ncbi:hypothetical protein HanRHA438_Chr16g0741811 [Helianthus annuus]|nr:hypothetical protein HanRHA438_Chr16g0741811 [Helianthus annuus]